MGGSKSYGSDFRISDPRNLFGNLDIKEFAKKFWGPKFEEFEME